MPLTPSARLTRALTALRLAAERGRGDRFLTVRTHHLWAMLEAWDRDNPPKIVGECHTCARQAECAAQDIRNPYHDCSQWRAPRPAGGEE